MTSAAVTTVYLNIHTCTCSCDEHLHFITNQARKNANEVIEHHITVTAFLKMIAHLFVSAFCISCLFFSEVKPLAKPLAVYKQCTTAEHRNGYNRCPVVLETNVNIVYVILFLDLRSFTLSFFPEVSVLGVIARW